MRDARWLDPLSKGATRELMSDWSRQWGNYVAPQAAHRGARRPHDHVANAPASQAEARMVHHMAEAKMTAGVLRVDPGT